MKLYTLCTGEQVRDVIKGSICGESCGNVGYAIMYGIRVILGHIRNCHNFAQQGSARDLMDGPDVQGAHAVVRRYLFVK